MYIDIEMLVVFFKPFIILVTGSLWVIMCLFYIFRLEHVRVPAGMIHGYNIAYSFSSLLQLEIVIAARLLAKI
jgi:hypothetical protein